MLTKEQAAQLINELEGKLHLASGFGVPNSTELKDIRVLLFKLRDAPLNGVVLRERLATLKNWIEILFGHSSHERFGGTETVRGYTIQHCEYLLALMGIKPFQSVG